MAVQCAPNYSIESIRSARIDFTAGGQFKLPETVPSRCIVLKSDKMVTGDKSTTGSPTSSHRGSSSGRQEEISSSGSSRSVSPLSFTQDLLGTDSPGLCSGAGGLTPKMDLKSPKSPDPKYPTTQATVKDVPAVKQAPRRSRFDEPPSIENGQLKVTPTTPIPTVAAAPALIVKEEAALKENGQCSKLEGGGDCGNSSIMSSRGVKRRVEESSEDNNEEEESSDDEVWDTNTFLRAATAAKRIKREEASKPSTSSTPSGATTVKGPVTSPLKTSAVSGKPSAASAVASVSSSSTSTSTTISAAFLPRSLQTSVQQTRQLQQQQGSHQLQGVQQKKKEEEDRSSSSSPDVPASATPIIGPQLPPQSNGYKVPQSNGGSSNGSNGVNGIRRIALLPAGPAGLGDSSSSSSSSPSPTESSSSGAAAPSSSTVTTSTVKAATTTTYNKLAAASGLNGSGSNGHGRKRLLSERGEEQLSYPIQEKEIIGKWNWRDVKWISEQRMKGCGLINRANDCFLNVILQMITHTAPLARYLVERHEKDCRRPSNCLACALSDFIPRSFKQQQPMSTNWIRPHLGRIFPMHEHGMQEDAHELLALVLDAIDPPPGSHKDNGNKELPASKKPPSTPVEQIFGGTLRNQVTCQTCQTPYINYERIRELNVAISKRGDEKIPLKALVADYFKNETIQAFTCKKCNRKTQAVRVTRVLRAPSQLLIQLKRFNAYGGKIKQPVLADRELDIAPFTFDSGVATTDGGCARYALTAVVEHLGGGVDHGHYIAYAKGVDGQTWFKFDDEEVIRSGPGGANPYLLVYARREGVGPVKNGCVNGIISAPAIAPSKLMAANNAGGGGRPPQQQLTNGNNGYYGSNGGGGGGINNGYSKPYMNGGGGGMNKPNGYYNGNGNGGGHQSAYKYSNGGGGGGYQNNQNNYNRYHINNKPYNKNPQFNRNFMPRKI